MSEQADTPIALTEPHSADLRYLRAFAEALPNSEFVQAVLAQLPWYHQLAQSAKGESA